MVENDKRIRIISGHYGSGKTEFALNYIKALSKVSKKPAIADLDIVNVYFRSRERRIELEKSGIKVISSSILGNSSDMPAISSEVYVPLRDKSYDYVIDLGGNNVGTIVLGRLKALLEPKEIDFFMVVNINRPETSTVETIIKHMKELESSTNLKVTGFVNNTNLIRETDYETIKEGNKVLLEVSKNTKVPIRYTSYMKEIFNIDNRDLLGELFPMELFMRKSWM